MRMIKDLLKHGDKVWLCFTDEKIWEQFKKDAKEQGFEGPDHYNLIGDNIYVHLKNDHELSRAVWCQVMIIGYGGNGYYIVDYKKYKEGKDDYRIINTRNKNEND